ncbi:MAG: TIGR03960 family B12-binding radical SAM protein [Candidatus Omnitrophica bacterium]|nr:TIGR03960 family B12-binding radical SAM protein [Candidatus Omnitrophota bacterium]
MLEKFLLEVNKPARYIGQEWNIIKKDFDKANIKFALCFPDLYEVGMSNLGFRILYGILNNQEDIICERFFSVDSDLERILRSNRQPIFSLESRHSLREFDIIGFSLSYELNYTNVLNMLELGGIPWESSLRDADYPLVIGGGPCTFNPEPLHEFFDLFFIGEAEEAILEIIDIYRRNKEGFKKKRINKDDLLLRLSTVEGIYVPSLYEVIYDSQYKIRDFKPRYAGLPTKIKKRFVKDLNQVYFPWRWLIPYIQIIHDHIILEIMRGCPHHCRFCQATIQYHPYRQRSLEEVLSLALKTYQQTGYEEITLSGLSISDYPYLERLVQALMDLFKDKAVNISLPSIKPKAGLRRTPSLIAKVKKSGLTFAPEAASQRLRQIINKDFSMEEFFKVLKEAYLSGYRHVKLYFMIGLPLERQEDLDSIIDFSCEVSEFKKTITKGSPARVNVSINALVPKPHTPFQWLAMENLEAIFLKQNYLKNKVKKNKNIFISFHNPRMSFLEGVLSRGDRRLSKVILCAFKKGARFDAWDNYFRFDLWLDAFRECDINADFYLKERGLEEILPWDFIDTGISKQGLLKAITEIKNTVTTI